MKWVHKILVIASIAFFLNGCVKKEILDDINLIEAIGFDYAGDGNTSGTILYPIYQPDQPPENKTLTAKALIKKSILQDIQLQAANPIVTGSMEAVLFAKELATKEGVLELIDAFQRDPGVGSGLYLAVVDGEARELMDGNYGVRGNATFISNLLENNIENEDLPKTNLQKFLFSYYQEGQTPFMPQLKKISDEKIELNGVCFFKHGKVVETISSDQMFFFRLLVDKYSNGLHRVKIKDGEAAVRSIRSTHNFDLSKRSPLEITVKIKVQGIVNEYTGNEVKPEQIKQLENAFGEEIKKQSQELVDIFKEQKIDPVGFGHFVKTRKRKYDLSKWLESDLKNLTVKVVPDVTITEAGVIE
ncbi:Ger(x)C family spore germination protein [Robertmurraya kyonggiensis]|uniref:Ger(X)C family spore germination protein n=1 Tax=Robertmurraya kyonggiensis TaxID=1037680 RepID=A0A4U1D128_9BACI|nr:Ger(x)C family spore germination protein [Robertmurraya kyonggiensis]TKC15383.1 Ger(x)C family spore germination protein [Robertmurraya kyonggiensis]